MAERTAAMGAFGALLKRHRELRALSQEDLADATGGGVAVRTISDLERGVARRPRSETVRLLAEALRLSGEELAAFTAAARAWQPGADQTPAASPAAAAVVSREGRPVPRMLPRDTESFTGRTSELDRLVTAASASYDSGGVVGIYAVEGMGGVGKTALALRAAHLVAAGFPDGQLFIDLQGYTPGVGPLAPAEALGSLLRALGVPREEIPDGLAGRAALYRGRLAGTRTLVVLDNAASLAQVDPLLPGTAGCLVLITSRRALSGLDSQVVMLDTLPPADAAALFRAAAGPGRVAADDPDVAEIVALCGCLPLAIKIMGARLARRRALTAADILAELRKEHKRLAHLADEDRNVAAVFELSYRHLPAIAQRMFGQLGHVPGPDFDSVAAVNVVDDADANAAAASLDTLLDHSLLGQHAPGRYRFHDLVRDFAREKSGTLDDAGLDRILGYYLYSAQEADEHLERRVQAAGPGLRYPVLKPRQLPDVSTAARALAWLGAELPNLAGATRVALAIGRPGYTVAMAEALAQYLRSNSTWSLGLELQRLALDAAVQLGDLALQASAQVQIGLLQLQDGRSAQAVTSLSSAVDGFRRAGDRNGLASALARLGVVYRMKGEHELARASLEEALAAYPADGDRQGQATALRELGATYLQTGQFGLADQYLTEATAIFRELGDRVGEAAALNFLGGIRMTLKQYAPACEALEAAAALYRALVIPNGEANCLLYLGKAHLDAGAAELAERTLTEAGEIYTRIADRHGQAGVLAYLGEAHRLAGKNREARETLEAAIRLFRELGDLASEGETTNMYAAVALAEGMPEEARSWYARALRMARTVSSLRDEADALEGIAATHQAQARVAAATRQYVKALAAYESMEASADAARVRSALAGLVP